MKSNIKREMLRVSLDKKILDQFKEYCEENYLSLKFNVIEILILTLLENKVDNTKILDDVSYRSLRNLIHEAGKSSRSIRRMRKDKKQGKLKY